MLEKQNRTIEKAAVGDSSTLDSIVDFATEKMRKVHVTDPNKNGDRVEPNMAAPVEATNC